MGSGAPLPVGGSQNDPAGALPALLRLPGAPLPAHADKSLGASSQNRRCAPAALSLLLHPSFGADQPNPQRLLLPAGTLVPGGAGNAAARSMALCPGRRALAARKPLAPRGRVGTGCVGCRGHPLSSLPPRAVEAAGWGRSAGTGGLLSRRPPGRASRCVDRPQSRRIGQPQPPVEVSHWL